MVLFSSIYSHLHTIHTNRIADPSQRENLGIIVQYKVKVKLCIGGPILGGYVDNAMDIKDVND